MSPARLSHMQRVNERFMDKTCAISRNAAATVKGAPAKPDFQPVPPGTPVICAVTTFGRPDEQEVALQLQGQKSYTLSVPFGTDLKRNDRVIITSIVGGSPVTSETYQVIGVDDASTHPTCLDALIRAVGATI